MRGGVGLGADADTDVRGGPEPAARPPDLRTRLLAPPPPPSVWGWLGPLLVAALAGALRLLDLGRPRALVFDETYYVKQAYSLLTLGYEGRWGEDADDLFVRGDFSALTSAPEYVVHPPVGKWLIAAGMHVLGPENPVGWRLGTAVAGTLTVLLLARVARRLLSSTLLGSLAGLFLALDGVHVVESRVGLLDVFLGLFAVAGFGAVVLDRERSRARLARGVTSPWGPGLGIRWWLVVAGVLCGLAIGVKWSGAYVLAVLGVLAVVWSVTARRTAGVRLWWAGGMLRDGVPAFLSLVPVAALTYLATWGAWFATPRAYLRDWAARHPEQEQPWLPDVLDSWWYYHRSMWDFHTGLSAQHDYEAGPLGWLVQWRPTSFFWQEVRDPEAACSAARCGQAITSVGNPVVWWAGAIALVVVVVAAARLRDWRAWTVLAGYGALWVPWFFYPERTTFTFYAVALAPFVALALTYGIGLLIGWRPGRRRPPLEWERTGPWVALGVVVLAVGAAAFFWPVWTAEPISIEQWQLRMWLRSWV